jgi:hypothetical protein
MVPFAGWAMPIQYKDSLMESAQHCRKAAALFDVAHMCGLSLKVCVGCCCLLLPVLLYHRGATCCFEL